LRACFFSFPTTDEGKGVEPQKRKQVEVANAHDNGEDVPAAKNERTTRRRARGGTRGMSQRRVQVDETSKLLAMDKVTGPW
jgi:hypothetical protein